MILSERWRLGRWLALVTFSVPLGSCGNGVLNPSLIGFFSGNAAGGVQVPAGSVVVMFINKTTGRMDASMFASLTNENQDPVLGATFRGTQLIFSQAEGDLSNLTRQITVLAGEYLNVSIPCGVSSLQLLTVSIDGSSIGNFPGRAYVGGVNLRCGGVISVKVVPDGSDPDVPPDDDDDPDVIIEDFIFPIPQEITSVPSLGGLQ